MQRLPDELFQEIGEYLNIYEHQCTRLTHKNFHSQTLYRKLRFGHCLQIIQPKTITNGMCSVAECHKQKVMCIEVEPLRSKILCNYCSIHARTYLDFNLNELL